jgi:uncharacterized protein (DUF4415 family)
MNNRGILRVSKDQLAEMIDETDWARIAAMTEADLERAAAEDPDAIDHRRRLEGRSRRLAADDGHAAIIQGSSGWFRRQGRGYQARIDAVLRAFVKAQER